MDIRTSLPSSANLFAGLKWLTLILVTLNLVLHFDWLQTQWNIFHGLVGWVIYPLAMLTVVLVFTYVQLLVSPLPKDAGNKQVTFLFSIVTYAAPTLGFVGTISGLQLGLDGFQSAASPEALSAALNNVVGGLTVSLSSTLFGGCLGLISGLSSLIYTHFNLEASNSQHSSPAKMSEADKSHTPGNAKQLDALKRCLNAIGLENVPLKQRRSNKPGSLFEIVVADSQPILQVISKINTHKIKFGLADLAIFRGRKSENSLFVQLPN
jgi:hypothetical protein